MKTAEGIRLRGHLTVRREDGSVMFEGENMIPYAGINAIVDVLQGAAYTNN